MDIIRKRGVPGGQGNAVTGYSDFVARSGSWQYGADAFANDISDEAAEEDNRFGVPRDPTLHFDEPGSPGASNTPAKQASPDQKSAKPPNPGTPVSRANAANWNKPGGGYEEWKAGDAARETTAGQPHAGQQPEFKRGR